MLFVWSRLARLAADLSPVQYSWQRRLPASALHVEEPLWPLLLSKLREDQNGACCSTTTGGAEWCYVVRAEQPLPLSAIVMQPHVGLVIMC